MLLLTLVRHAKAEDPSAKQPDQERALQVQGCLDANNMANWCEKNLPVSSLWLVSLAKRAQQTAELLSNAAALCTEERLYSASPAGLLGLIQEHGKDHAHVTVVGHNPTISQTAQLLAGNNSDLPIGFPTLGLAHFSLPVDNWEKLRAGSAMVVSFITPKLLSGHPS